MWQAEHDSRAYEGHSLNADNQPVVYFSWDDAKAFTERLTEQHDGEFTFRLPSESQWEYAARAGTTTSRYWGDNPDEACEYANVRDKRTVEAFGWSAEHKCDDGYTATASVGNFRSNSFGLYDMLGMYGNGAPIPIRRVTKTPQSTEIFGETWAIKRRRSCTADHGTVNRGSCVVLFALGMIPAVATLLGFAWLRGRSLFVKNTTTDLGRERIMTVFLSA